MIPTTCQTERCTANVWDGGKYCSATCRAAERVTAPAPTPTPPPFESGLLARLGRVA